MDDLHAPDVPGYAVDRLLGLGSSASVWLPLSRPPAGNTPSSASTPAPASHADRGVESRTAVRREIRILSVLDHQHLVTAHDAVSLHPVPTGDAEGQAATALIMDYASGGSLGQLLGPAAGSAPARP